MTRLQMLTLACSIALWQAPLRANDIQHIAMSGTLPVGASGTVTLPAFDPSLGVLRLVHVTVSGRVSGTWGVENTNPTPWGIGGYAAGHHVGAAVPATLPSGGILPAHPAFLPDPVVPLTAFDGTVDFGGTSGHTFTFTNEMGDGGPSQYADMYVDALLPAWIGPGSVSIGIGPIGQYGPYGPPNFQHVVTLTADAIVGVRYTYDPFPTHVCRAQIWSGCPCNNMAMAPNAGCGNSQNSMGAVLDSAGQPSISADSVTLSGSGMTNSYALYFQGTGFTHAQSVYGDGLRCVNGSVVRLATKLNASGVSQYPAAGDLPISVRGGITQPGLRYYQIAYRDVGSFCTPSPFNATSGRAILWRP